jgi:oxygen-independent coproporphyrinogen-3 oxidase
LIEVNAPPRRPRSMAQSRERTGPVRAELVRLFENDRVPRYTSYPTAPHFGPQVDARTYAGWLAGLDPQAAASLYVHIPWCRQLCWYCGCHTYITVRESRAVAYLDPLLREIDLVAARLPGRLAVAHLHFGGGTPQIVGGAGLARVREHLAARFDFRDDAAIAIELDPRGVDDALAAALAAMGVTRASLGVQTLDPEVQRAINREQPAETVAAAAAALRRAGIAHLSVDLLYGLPRQTGASARETARRILELVAPARVAVFGYAHLPQLRRHQRMIPAGELPGALERVAQFEAIAEVLQRAGYVPVGLDHFARPDDSMAVALRERRLRRNFQGYTTDTAEALLGFGASAIGSLPQGYVQNLADLRGWREAVAEGRLPVARGRALTVEDRALREVIEAIMCYGEVDLEEVAARHRLPLPRLSPDPEGMSRAMALGLVRRSGSRLTVPAEYRPLLRVVASAFDRYLAPGTARHAVAV